MRKILSAVLFGFGALLIAGIDEEAVAQRGSSGGPPVVDVQNTSREAERAIKEIFGD